jgi:glutamate racemase
MPDAAMSRRVHLDTRTKAEIANWKAGDSLLLNGKMLTGRDAAHKRIQDMLAKGEPLPVDFTNRVIYYVGPVDPVRDEVVGPAGPTTSTRMDKFTEMMLAKTGLIGMIGKSERGPEAIEAIRNHKAAYLMAVGGAAYLVSKAIKKSRVLGFADLGMEAIYEFDVVDMPVTVAVDAGGTSVHTTGPAQWQKKIASGEFKNIAVTAACTAAAALANARPIGVFDSGIGGLSILKALRAELPDERFVYLADTAHAPYGERDDAYVIARTHALVRRLRDEHAVKALVIACNTATAAAIQQVRSGNPDLPVVGVEPALKPALALTRTRRIAVLATRGTLASAKFAALHDAWKAQAEFVLQPCDGLAAAIEADDAPRISALCRQYLRSAGEFGTSEGRIDTVVLGCTHYPFAAAEFSRHAGPGVHWVETGAPVARQTRRLLEAAAQLDESLGGGVEFFSTGAGEPLLGAARRWHLL